MAEYIGGIVVSNSVYAGVQWMLIDENTGVPYLFAPNGLSVAAIFDEGQISFKQWRSNVIFPWRNTHTFVNSEMLDAMSLRRSGADTVLRTVGGCNVYAQRVAVFSDADEMVNVTWKQGLFPRKHVHDVVWLSSYAQMPSVHSELVERWGESGLADALKPPLQAPSPVLGQANAIRQRPPPASIVGAVPVTNINDLTRSQRLTLLVSPVAPIAFHSDLEKIDALQSQWRVEEESDPMRMCHIERNNDVAHVHEVEHTINWVQRASENPDIAASHAAGFQQGLNVLRDFDSIVDVPLVKKAMFYGTRRGLLDLPVDVVTKIAEASVDAAFRCTHSRDASVLLCSLRATCTTFHTHVDLYASSRLIGAHKRLQSFVDGTDVDEEIERLALQGGLARWSYQNFSCNAALLLQSVDWSRMSYPPPLNTPVHVAHMRLRNNTEYGDYSTVCAARSGRITPTLILSKSETRVNALWAKSAERMTAAP
jgi:hypothetical protein